MSLIKVTALDGNKAEIQLGIQKTALDEQVKVVYKKQVVNMNVPGFRKGKAPLSMLKKMYGESIFVDEALNDLLPAAYEEAYKEAAIEAVSAPTFDIVSMDDNGVVVLKATVDLKPVPKIGEYKGLAVEREIAPITDEAVDAEIASAQKRAAREIEVTDRAAQMGDTANIDYEGFCDGVAFAGGKGEDYALKLGSGTFIPGFEEGVVGHKVDEEFDVVVTFPTEYHSADLAGKEATFKCKIHALTRVELPTLDDDFAKDVSEFDTFAEYKADLVAKIEKRHADSADATVTEQIFDALIEKMVADIPAPMFDAEVENFLRDYDSRLRMSGLDLNTYCKYTGMNLDQLREQFRPQAERQVKARLALEKVAELENVEVTEEDINAEYERIAAAYSMTADKVKESLPSDVIVEDLRVKKAMDLVREKAVVTDVAPEAPKAE